MSETAYCANLIAFAYMETLKGTGIDAIKSRGAPRMWISGRFGGSG